MAETEFCEQGTRPLHTTATQERELSPHDRQELEREGQGGSRDRPRQKGT
jgi:hypothetical protein